MVNNNDLKYKMSPEHELLLCCARYCVDGKTEARIISLVEKGINWEYLIEIAVQHRLINLLYFQLNTICPEAIPETVLEDLKAVYHINAKNNLRLTGELFKILEFLKSNNIKRIAYKGPLLAIQAYKNISLRQFSDLDIFVHKADVLKVKDLLISNGYRLYYDLNHISGSFYLKTQREYIFINDETGIIVEIHWNFHGAFLSLPNDYECLCNDLKMVTLNCSSILSLNDDNLIIVLCLHCANHDWESFSWICDISELIRSNEDINWQYILETAQKLGIKRIVLVNLLFLNELFEIKIPNQILNQINSDNSVHNLFEIIKMKIFFEDEIKFNFTKKAIFDFKKRESRIYGIKDVIRTLIIPTYIDFIDIKLPAFLYPVYYIVRPVLLFRRLGFGSVHSNK